MNLFGYDFFSSLEGACALNIVLEERHGFSPLVSAQGFSACLGRSWKTLTGYKPATWLTMHCCLVLSSL
jgi:hypothetical protein